MAAQLRAARSERRRLVMQCDDACGAQDRLAQPAHAENEERDAHAELQPLDRNALEQRPGRDDDDGEQRERGSRAERGHAPAAYRRGGEHDGESFDRLDERGEESGRDGGRRTER